MLKLNANVMATSVAETTQVAPGGCCCCCSCTCCFSVAVNGNATGGATTIKP
ncbi:streptolysin S family TOMM toxin [Streptococcus didelphis]|uniref:Streptolysin S family TOMM toxin n=2 Tax=Streptococcus didelphis TaxID=102886 RepID=A0ABY9LKX9_9STRE|nr:streptolysin S family TOMM toxin [Streptococcus didelphis]WMB28830.1 streptolysin S family TOMM toxin [Streptococcus didelphis]WMB29919.1 streptolysin S family TOMM toxin [Streptococcus didelphis]